MQSQLEAKMQDQTSKLLSSALDTRDIVYNEGLKDNLQGANQRIDALQKRLDNSTRNMSDIAKRNDAMSADFRQIGETLSQSTQAINTNSNWLKRVINSGFYVTTQKVTESVAREFEEIIGKPLDSFLTDAIQQKLKAELQSALSQTSQSRADVQVLANEVEDATRQNIEITKSLKGSINTWIIEFSIILGATIATPGWWKILMLIATTLGSIVFNSYLDKEIK